VCYLVWWKNNLNIADAFHLVFATEFIVLGWRSGLRNRPAFLDPNPTKRHNVIIGPQQRHFHSFKGSIVNPYQKPAYLAYSLCKAFCTPASTILVVGFGAGGDIEGAVAAKMNVIAFEKDSSQYEAVVGIWRAYQAKLENFPLEDVFPSAKVGKLGCYPAELAIPPHFLEKVAAYVTQLCDDEEQSKLPGKDIKCAACDDVVGSEKTEYTKCTCGAAVCKKCSDLVKEAAGDQSGSKELFCSQDCWTTFRQQSKE
jgi:hypothetical protein